MVLVFDGNPFILLGENFIPETNDSFDSYIQQQINSVKFSLFSGRNLQRRLIAKILINRENRLFSKIQWHCQQNSHQIGQNLPNERNGQRLFQKCHLRIRPQQTFYIYFQHFCHDADFQLLELQETQRWIEYFRK